MSVNSKQENDDLTSANFWQRFGHKLIIIIITGLCVLLFVLHIDSSKKYTATAIFQIDNEKTNGFNIQSLVRWRLSQVSMREMVCRALEHLERVTAREFILQVSKKLS